MKESKLHTALTWIIDIVVSGLLWCLCSLPVITVGTASTALYYAVVKSIRHERGYVGKCFWAAFRSNFRCSTLVWLLYLAGLAVGTINVLAARQMGAGSFSPLTGLAGIIAVPILLTLPWIFAYISRFENSVTGSLRFVFFLAMKNIGRSLLLAAELLAALAIVWLIPQIAPLLPGLFALLMSLSIEPVFRPYTAGAEGEGLDAWYNE